MAEYITKEQVIEHVIGHGNLFLVNELENLPNADVVERSKYDNLHNLAKSWLEEKKELEKANDELRSKIDKAIEEIEQSISECRIRWAIIGMEHVLEILKRNIGE